MSTTDSHALLINADPVEEVQESIVSIRDERKRNPVKALLLLNTLVFLYYMAFSPLRSTTDQYVKEMLSVPGHNIKDSGGRQACINGSDSENMTEQTRVESKTSVIMTIIDSAGMIPIFISTFLLGPCSDKMGRKIALILPLIGGFIKAIIYMTTSYFELSYYFLCVGSFIEGLSGSTPLLITGAVAYTADLTECRQRSIWICVIEVANGLSKIISSIGSGYVIQLFDYIWMFSLTAGIFLLGILICRFGIKETIVPQEGVKVFTTQHIKNTISIYTKDNGTSRRWKLLLLLIIIALSNLGNHENSDVFVLTLINRPICFTPELLGYFVACIYLIKTVGSLGMMKLTSCGINDGALLLISIGSYIVFQVIMSGAYHIGTLFTCTLVAFAQLLVNPITLSLTSKLGSKDEQGAMCAASLWIKVLCILLASVCQNAIYSSTVSIWRGFIFLVDASVTGLCFLLVCVLLMLWKREDSNKGERANTEHSDQENMESNSTETIQQDNPLA